MNSKKKLYFKINRNIDYNKKYNIICLKFKKLIVTQIFISKLKRELVGASRRGFDSIEYKYIPISPYLDLRAVRAYFDVYFEVGIEETNFLKIVEGKACQIVSISIKKRNCL